MNWKWSDVWIPLPPEQEREFLIDILRVLIVVSVNICMLGVAGLFC